ncbi:major histocompatibility complex class I-related gene protein-like isoform X2 [Misgurnus anguillicaudatus]|uniref:major histocompatibility complex class I-related gene protein-like isoform X2 n=1 Tax=Misgurnus anguillicaudatus TaxID=75329 RepID=UPI003CCFBAAD
MRSVALLLVGILAFSGPHSMFQLYIGVSGVSNFPEVTVVTQVDDEPITYFDTNTMKAVPKTEWMTKSKDEDYWNRKTENTVVLYNQYKNNMLSIMNIFNHSKSDVHTLQLMFGCELENDGTSRGYMHIGYDGEDFMSLDMKTLKWIPASLQAATFKQTLEGNKDQEYLKTCVENKCIEALQKYVIYSKESLEKKDPPEVALLQKNSSSPVICHATGYPKDITMTWMKNHEELYEDVEVSSTLPNTDGSFQKSISLLVNPEEWKKNPDVYRCVVQSVGKGKEIVVLLNENNIKTNSGMCKCH